MTSSKLYGVALRVVFAFSPEEGQKVWNELAASGELSDLMLEAVAGGVPAADVGDGGK